MVRKTDGARATGAVANVIADVLHNHMHASEQTRSDQSIRHTERQMEAWESELATVITPLIEGIFPDGLDEPTADAILGFIARPTHSIDLLFQIAGIIPLIIGVMQAAAAPSIQDTANFVWPNKPTVPLSAQQAAGATIRGWITQGEGEHWAAKTGVNAEVFNLLVETGRLPPAPGEILEGWRRGFVGPADVRKAIIESDIGSDWADFFMKLKFAPMSPALAVQAAVQSHIGLPEAQSAFAQGGEDPAHFEVAYETAGEPPGVESMITLLHKGLMTEAQVRQGIAESRVKNKYVDAIIAGQYKTVPLRSVTSFITKGILSDAEGMHQLQMDGYQPDLAHKIVAAAHVTKTAATHALTQGEILALYKAGEITRAVAISTLVALGHNASDVALMLGLADHQIEQAASRQLIGIIRSAYLAGGLSRTTASSDLDRTGIAASARDQLLTTWDAEVQTRVRPLSEAQIMAAAKKQIIAPAEAFSRLTFMGYLNGDALILMNTAGVDTTGIGA